MKNLILILIFTVFSTMVKAQVSTIEMDSNIIDDSPIGLSAYACKMNDVLCQVPNKNIPNTSLFLTQPPAPVIPPCQRPRHLHIERVNIEYGFINGVLRRARFLMYRDVVSSIAHFNKNGKLEKATYYISHNSPGGGVANGDYSSVVSVYYNGFNQPISGVENRETFNGSTDSWVKEKIVLDLNTSSFVLNPAYKAQLIDLDNKKQPVTEFYSCGG